MKFLLAILLVASLHCASSPADERLLPAQALDGRSQPGLTGEPIYFLTYRFVDARGVETMVHDQVVNQFEFIRYWKALVPFCVQPHALVGLRLVPCTLTVPYPTSDQASKGAFK